MKRFCVLAILFLAVAPLAFAQINTSPKTPASPSTWWENTGRLNPGDIGNPAEGGVPGKGYFSILNNEWIVSPDAAITDHGDATDDGSLAWVLSEATGTSADVALPGNHVYPILQNVTVAAGINYKPAAGAIIKNWLSVAGGGSAWTVVSGSIYQMALANEPAVLRESDVALTKVANVGSIDAAGKWCWNAGQLMVRTTGSVDPDTLGANVLKARYSVTFADGSNLTENGMQIFDVLDGEIIIAKGVVSAITPRMFGAVGDGATDDSVAFNVAGAVAGAAEIKFETDEATYATEHAVTIPNSCDVNIKGKLLYTGTGGETALTIGKTDARYANRTIYIQSVERDSQSNWGDDNDVGVIFYNNYYCRIECGSVIGFTKNVSFRGENSNGNVYNIVTMGYIGDAKYGLELRRDSGGWVNENLFLGGEFKINSGTNTGIARYGVYSTTMEPLGNRNGENVFIKPSFELNGNDTIEECIPIWIEYGDQFLFTRIRDESNSDYGARVTNGYRNVFEFAFGSSAFNDLTDAQNNKYTLTSNIMTTTNPTNIFSIGNLHKLACYADAGGASIRTSIAADVHLSQNSTGTPVSTHTSLIILPTYLNVVSTRGVGVYVDTSTAKRFVVTQAYVDSNPGRLHVTCFDATGTVLSGTSPYYVFGDTSTAMNSNADWGGSYQPGSDKDSVYFRVADAVKYVRIAISNGYMTGFSIYSWDGPAGVWSGLDGPKGVNVGTAAPNRGAHLFGVGRRVYNSVPASGQPQGWVVENRKITTVSGVEAAGQTVITVVDATTVSTGDIVAILLDDGTWHETTVNGAPAGNDVTITDALPNVASNTEFYANRWIAMPNF